MKTIPTIFFGHGSPMNAIEKNKYTEVWKKIGEEIPRPKAILAISAHWYVDGSFVTSNQNQKTIYDFYGFPPELYAVKYDVKGDVDLAEKICKLIPEIKLNNSWGIDHGTWSVLKHVYPNADIPVLQLSINRNKNAQYHYDLAKKLNFLRDENILIIGSGNIVHNLGMINWQTKTPYDWAIKFNNQIREILLNNNHQALINYNTVENYKLSIPTPEHFLPTIYIAALQRQNEKISIFNDEIDLGSISMMGFMIGN
jgi:4,5-DOPA dioxygenase extradiol